MKKIMVITCQTCRHEKQGWCNLREFSVWNCWKAYDHEGECAYTYVDGCTNHTEEGEV